MKVIDPEWIIKTIHRWMTKITSKWWIRWTNNITKWIKSISSIRCKWITWECSNKLAINNRIKASTNLNNTHKWIIIGRIRWCIRLWLWIILHKEWIIKINNIRLSNSSMAIHLLTWCIRWTTAAIHNNSLKLVEIQTWWWTLN